MSTPQTEVIVLVGGREVDRRLVGPGDYLIGRGDDCHISIPSDGVSAHHARLSIAPDRWSVADLGSANGTRVNDRPVRSEPARVWPSQLVHVGDASIELRPAPASGADPGATLAPSRQTVLKHLPPELHGTSRYQIGNEVAKGGMGAILSAADKGIRRDVAMKVMLDTSDQAAVLRFIEEAQVTGQLEHPNIVPVHELNVNAQGEVFYTMKMVRGVTLKDVLTPLAMGVPATAEQYPLPVLLTVFQKICDAIAFAHSKGVLHRDLKPENIMLGDFGEVLVMDWGLARLIGSGVTQPTLIQSAKADEGDAMHTRAGSIMGTPGYMSPEQARGDIAELDARSDIYALGTILFEILHLRPAYTGTAVMEVVEKMQRGEVRWNPAKPDVPASLLAVCRKALAPGTGDRYPDVRSLQADIRAYQNGFATSAENASAWRQLSLLVKRHKATTVGIAAVLAVGATLGTKAIIEGRRAEQALVELHGTAPTFIEQAKTLIASNDIEAALENATAATRLAPEIADYHTFRAHLLLALPDVPAAAEAYRAALALAESPEAREHLTLCETLLVDEPDITDLSTSALASIHSLTSKYDRPSHTVFLLSSLNASRTELIKAWTEKLESHDLAPEWIKLQSDGTIRLKARREWDDLTPLRGMPVSDLVLDGCESMVDLRPLAGMPLRELDISRTSVVDLDPLHGMQIEVFRAIESEISSLEPLQGMPIRVIQILHARQITDLTPLRDAPLEEVDIQGTGVKSLDALQGRPVRDLAVTATIGFDFSGLNRLPLENLHIYDQLRRIRDFAPILEGLNLKELRLSYSGIDDLRMLAAMPLELLILTNTPVSSLAPLSEAPLRRLYLTGTRVSDLAPLAEIDELEILDLRSAKQVRDLSPLAGSNVKSLILAGIPNTLDLAPLASCPELTSLILPENHTNIESLRDHPALSHLSEHGHPRYPETASQHVSEFWREYDAERPTPDDQPEVPR